MLNHAGQMYGEFDPNTREWQDGIMSTMYRHAAASTSSDRTVRDDRREVRALGVLFLFEFECIRTATASTSRMDTSTRAGTV